MKFETVYFKNSETGKHVEFQLDICMPVSSLRNCINGNILRGLNIDEEYRIVKGGQPLMEYDSNIDERSDIPIHKLFKSSDYFIQFYITTNSFYSQKIQYNCSICYNSFIRLKCEFPCGHHRNVCHGCVHLWVENCDKTGKHATCPLCRMEI